MEYKLILREGKVSNSSTSVYFCCRNQFKIEPQAAEEEFLLIYKMRNSCPVQAFDDNDWSQQFKSIQNASSVHQNVRKN
jgi:hypothetical protein